jgi:hypothetical protein
MELSLMLDQQVQEYIFINGIVEKNQHYQW